MNEEPKGHWTAFVYTRCPKCWGAEHAAYYHKEQAIINNEEVNEYLNLICLCCNYEFKIKTMDSR